MAGTPLPGAALADGVKKPVAPGAIARAIQGVRYALTGVRPDEWFGPSQPIAPQAQEQAAGRQFDYPTGFNLRWIPRAEEQISFAQLRGLADSYDLLRLVIETRKDQLAKMKWLVQPRDITKPTDERCQAITDFLRFPDKEHDWDTWLRMLLEDMFVIDAASIYPRMTRGGEIYSLDLLDGATIKRIITLEGRTPMAPDPAYQQILKGIPAVDYTRDELLYLPRNPRTSRVYGLSPVEQVVMTVNIALRRQIWQLQYYTEGNVPEAIYSVPAEWNPDQVRQFQDYWDSLLEGNTAARRHAKFVPGGINVHESRDPKLKDEHDEWLARVVCYAFSLPPTPFVKQQNRATAGTAQEAALEEGLAPLMKWVAGMMDQIIARWIGAPDLEFTWQEEEAVDPLEQAQVNQIYVTTKVKTPDEVREELGMDPLTPEQKEELNPPMPEMGETGPAGKPMPPGANANGDPQKIGKKKVHRHGALTGSAMLY